MLEVNGISYAANKKELISGITFSVKEGDSVSVVGPNGAGKTTLIKLLDGLLEPYSGGIELYGKNIRSYRRKELARLISYVPQNESAGLDFTAEEFVAGGRYPYMGPAGGIGAEDKRIIKTAMEDTDVYRFKDRPLWKMSGGERRRVFIAAALAQNAGIMLLDEPTVFLDPKSCGEINSLLTVLNRKKGITLITVTHDINYALLSGGMLLGIKNGRRLFYAEADYVYEQKAFDSLFDTPFIYIRGAGDRPQILPGGSV